MGRNPLWVRLLRLVQSDRPVPAALQGYFTHLTWDMAWMGIVAGSGASFLGVYVARLGATPFEMGLLNAGPALVGLLFTMPVGIWLGKQPMGQAVFWAAALTRAGYLLWVVLPYLLPPTAQIHSYIGLILVMTVPGTALAVGFNALYAAAVPPEWRAHVAGRRNAVYSLVFVLTSLLSGYLLDALPTTPGYPLIFGLGFVGAAMSTYHLWRLRDITTETITEPERIRSSFGDFGRPGEMRTTGMSMRTNFGLRAFTRGANLLRVDVLRGSYGRVVAALFVFHFAQFLPVPVFPLFWVDRLHFSDWEIGVATAAFHFTVLVGSLRFAKLNTRWGTHRLAVIGALLLSTYPLLTTVSFTLPLFILTSVIGGISWFIIAGAVGMHLLSQLPDHERPAYLAWYNLALNAAVLAGSLGGSLLAGHIGLTETLLVSAVVRVLAGLAIWRWK